MDKSEKETAAVSFAIANTNRNSNRYSNSHSKRNSNRRSFALRPLSFTPSIEGGYYLGNSLPRPPSYVHHDNGGNVFIENDLFQQARDQNIHEQSLREKSIRESIIQKPDQQDINNNEITDKEEEVGKFKPGYRFYLAFVALSVLALMVSLDGTSVSVALPILAADLHGTAIEAFWVGTSFLLTSSVFQPPLAALSHIFGRMPTLVFCIVCFIVGIMISALAQNFTAMLVGRTIQGVGGGGVILLNDVIITDLVPMRLRGAYFGIIGAIWGLGSVSGPVVGGVLASQASWRDIFWINIPFAVIGLIMVPIFLKLRIVPGSIVQKLKRVDWVGNVLFIAAATSFLIPLTWGGVQEPWDSWRTFFPLIMGILGLAGFCVYEKRFAVEPTIRLDILRDYNMAYSLFAALINALIVYGLLYFLPLYFEAVRGYNAILSGVALFPATLTVAPISIISGLIITKTGDFHVVTWIGWIATTIGCGILVLMDVDSTVPQWVFLCLVAGVGLGFLYTSLAFVNQSASDDKNMAFAISLFVFARALGQCIGVAICGVIFQNQMKKNLLKVPSLAGRADEYSRDASSLVATIKFLPGGQEKDDLVQAYADSLKIVWGVMCALSGVAMVGSFFVRRKTLDRAHNTEQGLKGGGASDTSTDDLTHNEGMI